MRVQSVPDARAAEIRALYARGLDDGEIGDRIGVSRSTVCSYRLRMGLPSLHTARIYDLPDVGMSDPPCRSTDPEVFFDPSLDGRGRADTMVKRQRRAAAKAICATCPLEVKAVCLEVAIATKSEGVWAGTTTEERRQMVRQGAVA